MTNFLQHLLGVLGGIAAVAVNIAILAILGSAVTLVSEKRQPNSLSNVTVPAACLVALYCWYGIKLNIPLPILLGAIACLAVMILAYRMSRDGPASAVADSQLATLFNARSTVFALFYGIAYLFVTPPVSTDQLPIVSAGKDILNYINVGDYLQHLGPSNIAGMSLERSLSYEATPAVFPALQAMAALLGGDIMQAAMPTILGVVALIGVAIASITQAAFALPRSAAIAIAAAVISGSLFRYTSGYFFLSQLMASLVLLLLLGRTVEFLGDKRPKGWRDVAATFAPHYILVGYLYPVVFLVIAAGLQTILVAGAYALPAALRGGQATGTGGTKATIVQWGAGISVCMAVVAAVDPMHAQQMVSWAFVLSKTEVGFPLSFISPAAILGLPGNLQITTRTAQAASIMAFLGASVVIGYFYLVRGMGRGPVVGRVLFLISILVFAIYASYFYLRGASYQQWKLATYLPLLMSFGWWAASVSIMRAPIKSRTVAALATPLLCALLVIGNFLSYALREPPMTTFSASYANLRALDMMGTWSDLYVRMSSYEATFFPVYFIRHKTLHLLSDSYYSKEQFDLASISPTRPLFVEGEECKPETPWTTTVVGVGCLYRELPTIEFGSNYQLSKKLPMSIEAEGLSHQEAWGRWSDGDKVTFRLFASSADLSKAPSGFVNFQIHPYMGRGAQRVSIARGEWRAEEVIGQPRTISVPYVRDDWKGADLQSMTITMALPDAVAPNAIEPTSGDMRKLAIGFAAIGVASTP